jgi:CRISPR-associated protein Cmr6
MADFRNVPLMFRAQIGGRCQLQFIPGNQVPDSVPWVDEWVDKAYSSSPEFGDEVQIKTYQVSWRFVTNGGQDEGIIRPVIGAFGWPFYPGSSMKGVFRQAGETLERQGELPAGTIAQYCGNDEMLSPGLLRFHGGYPTDQSWTKQLVDVIHPQQNWQVGIHPPQHSAYQQISLYRPELKFGISSSEPSAVDWDLVWKIWEKGLTQGLGCRVSAGYGQFQDTDENPLIAFKLKGQGPISKSIDNTLEFRPNIFRAALRGHALRIFSGLTSDANTKRIVDQLFGGIQNGTQWGLLLMNFQHDQLRIFEEDARYKVEGKLVWSLTRSLPEAQEKCLKKLIKQLMQFAMLLGGFGKSWRRADHSIFMPDYEHHVIGCHWQWLDPIQCSPVTSLSGVTTFINSLQDSATAWLRYQNIQASRETANWRESWSNENVQVWGRAAGQPNPLINGQDDCQAILWFHGSYREEYQHGQWRQKSINDAPLTGSLGQIGRIWHRMYPRVGLFPDSQAPNGRVKRMTPFHFEFLTIFPDHSAEANDFLEFLQSEQSGFSLLWGRD